MGLIDYTRYGVGETRMLHSVEKNRPYSDLTLKWFTLRFCSNDPSDKIDVAGILIWSCIG
jgi:hypothetical protein